MNFNDFFWHDSSIEEIYIDRSNPGKNDTVKIKINWIDRENSILEFYDCYALEMNMNFGIMAKESILDAKLILSSQKLEAIRKNWLEMGVNLYDLKCYQIITNSTGSDIKIYALGFIVKNI